MEGRIQHLLLSLVAACASVGFALAAPPALGATAEDLELEPLVVREPERNPVQVDEIDTENFEIGVFGGLMSVEDFGTNPVAGVRVAYNVTEDFFVEGVYARTQLDQTSFERLSGGAQILTDDERDMGFYNVSLGWNLFPGEAFVTSRYAFKGGLYLVAGVGSTEFGGDNRFTINAGFGYRMVATDWLALHLNVRDHMFDSDLLGENQTRHNIEFTGGLTFFF
ncbi:MAG: outer membrane beta-barrel domain-containing protein [Pseudomonadales bacterium]